MSYWDSKSLLQQRPGQGSGQSQNIKIQQIQHIILNNPGKFHNKTTKTTIKTEWTSQENKHMSPCTCWYECF